jgi:hypothetical protein
MRRRSAFIPVAPERVEDRVALSHGLLSSPKVAPVAHAPTTPPDLKIDLQGTVAGFATPNPSAPPGPGNLRLKGSGNVAPLGNVNLVCPFSILYGEPTFCNGDLTLFQTRGEHRGQDHRHRRRSVGAAGPPAVHDPVGHPGRIAARPAAGMSSTTRD